MKKVMTDKPVKAISGAGGGSFYPDLLAEKDGQTYYIVAKGCYHAYRIQTGIGQLDYYNSPPRARGENIF